MGFFLFTLIFSHKQRPTPIPPPCLTLNLELEPEPCCRHLLKAGTIDWLSLQAIKRSGRLFAVKPVMVFYALSFAVTMSITR